MKKILIIGSNSFAGSNFTDYLLDKNFKVYGVSRSKEIKKEYLSYKKNKKLKNFKFFRINLNLRKDIYRLIQIVKNQKIQYIANFAAQGMVAESWIKPEDWYFTNVVSNSILIKELSKLKIKKYLNFSTPEVYGNTSSLMKESNIFAPTTPYAISRSAQDFNLLAHFKTFNFPVTFTRAANIYGPYQQSYRIIPKIIISILTNKKIPIHGKGDTLRSFIYMQDVSRVLYKILLDKKNLGQTFHISTNKFINILELTKLINKLMGVKYKNTYHVNERDGKDLKYTLNSSKIRKKYSWSEKTNLEDGIINTINWVKKNFNYLKKSSLNYTHKK
ncbi:GDP-mannose 4,6-dehydratase [Candidatus Pelagibacter ubique]|nr:GDP-mannose 4,6-dehydratase [Candidatus Pelagibacter ubique]